MGQLPLLGAGGAGGGPVVKLKDVFTDTNGTALTAHTMDVGPGWSVSGGTWSITGNKAYQTATTDYVLAHADAGIADGTLTVALNPNNAAFQFGAVVRLTDANNCWYVRWHSDGYLDLQEVNGGTVTQRAQTFFGVAPA